MCEQTSELVSHIRINERIEPVDLPAGEPVTVRWWPVPNATAYRVSLFDNPHANTALWQSDLISDTNQITLSDFTTSASSRYWLVVEASFPDNHTTQSTPITFGTAPGIKPQDWQATPIWADPATAAANKGEQGDPNAKLTPAFSGLEESDSDAGDAFFQRPTIKQTQHNGLGWAFIRPEFTLPPIRLPSMAQRQLRRPRPHLPHA